MRSVSTCKNYIAQFRVERWNELSCVMRLWARLTLHFDRIDSNWTAFDISVRVCVYQRIIALRYVNRPICELFLLKMYSKVSACKRKKCKFDEFQWSILCAFATWHSVVKLLNNHFLFSLFHCGVHRFCHPASTCTIK